MDVKEVLSCYVDQDTNVIELSFRLSDDNEDIIRTDNIDFDLTKEYGYQITPENLNFLDYEAIQEGGDEDDKINDLDYNELINFLTEYYTLNPNSLPESQLF